MLPGTMSREKEIERLEQLGESEVRYQLAQFQYTGSTQLAEEWLKQKESQRNVALEDARISATKAAAEAAARSADAASAQARWAKWAAAIAAAAAIISAKELIAAAIKQLL